MDDKAGVENQMDDSEYEVQQQPIATVNEKESEVLPGSQVPPSPYTANPQPPPVAGMPYPSVEPTAAGVSPAYPPVNQTQLAAAGSAPYPEPGVAGQPPAPPPGYLPGQGQTPLPAGFQGAYLEAVSAATGGILGDNLAPKEVVWMPIPPNVSSSCPPGLEYLTQIDQLLVHQQIEIFELITNYETENKYRVRNTLGQQVYFANEHSSAFQRQCCGPGRAFSMSITDNTQREVIHLERPQRVYLNCAGASCYCCLSCCLPHRIEVQAPPGTVVGFVKQEALGIIHPWFSIQNADGDTILRMKGPALGCSCYSDANFFVLSADGTQEVGKISKQWGGLAKEYFTDADNFGIQFPMDLDVKMKAVMLGACFLIDFMFFEAPGGSHNRGGGGHHGRRH